MSGQEKDQRQNQNPEKINETVENQPVPDAEVLGGFQDASTLAEFDEEQATGHWEKGKEQVKETSIEDLLTQSPLDFDKSPGLQIRELDELAVNLGLLMTKALKEKPELDANGFRAWLQNNVPDNPVLKQSAGYLEQAFLGNDELSRFIQEGFPELFGAVQEASRLLEANKDNPNFLTESLEYLKKQKNDIIDHPDGVLQGAVDKGYEAATGIWEFTKKNSKKLAATALIVGGTFVIGKWLFGDKENPSNAEGKSSGGFWKSILGLGGLSLLGSELITKLWGGKTATEWVMEQITKLTEGITGKITETAQAAMKAPLISALSVVMGEEEAKKIVNDIFAKSLTEKSPDSPDSQPQEEALLGTIGGDAEWLEKTIGFYDKKAALIEQLKSMGFEAPDWLLKLSPSELIEAIGIDEVKNTTALWNVGKFGAVGFLLYKYASLRGLAINGGLYLLFIREGENSWGAELIKNRIQEMQALKENLYGKVGEEFPLLASALETLDIDFTLLTPHLDNFAEYAKSNPITTLAAANTAWLFRGFLWSAIQKAGVAFQKSLVFALQNPAATAAIAVTGFAYRKEFADFLVDNVIPFDGMQAPQSKAWFRNELYQVIGEKDESETENHVQEIVQSLTHEVGVVAIDFVEIAKEIKKGNIGLSLLETGETVIYYVVAGNPVSQVVSLAANDFWQLVENVTGGEESEDNMSSLWLSLEGVILSRFAFKGAVAYKSIWEASKTSASIGQKLPIRLLKSAGFPITAEGRFLVRSMLDFQAFANLRLSGHVGQVEGIVRDIDAIFANQSLSQAEKIVRVEKIAGDTQKIVPAKFAERLNTLKGFGTTHQSLRLYEQLGSIQEELRDLRQEVTQAGVTEQKRMEDITNRVQRIKSKITDYRSFASNLLGRWNRMTSIIATNIADSPQKLKSGIQSIMLETGTSAPVNVPVEPATTAARITPDTRSTSFNSSNVVRLDDHRPRPGGGSARMPVNIDPSPSTGGQRAPTIAPSESRPAATGTTGRLRTPAEIAATPAPKPLTQVGAIDGVEPGPGNTVRKANPLEASSGRPATRPLSAAELNYPPPGNLEAANDNIAKKLNLPLPKVEAVARGLNRVMTPAMVALVMSDIANSKEPEKTAAEHAVFLSIILGATLTLGPIGGLVALATVTVGGGEIAKYFGWSFDQLTDFAKEKFGFDIRAFGNSDTAAVREVARYSLGYLDPINRLADPFFEKMGFEFALGTSAHDFFGETEMASVNIDDKPMVMPVHQHGEMDIPKWNAYVQEQLGEVEKNQRLTQTEIERLQRAIELTPDKDSQLHTFYQDRLRTFQQKKEQLQILQTHWQLQIIDNTPREVEGLENKTTWLQRETMVLQEQFFHLQRMRLALSLPDSAFVEVIDRTEAIVLQNRNPLTDPTIRETFDQVAESDTILQFKTKVDQATSEKDFSVANLFTSYVTELEAVRDHARTLSVMGMWDQAYPEGAPLDLQKMVDTAPRYSNPKESAPPEASINLSDTLS